MFQMLPGKSRIVLISQSCSCSTTVFTAMFPLCGHRFLRFKHVFPCLSSIQALFSSYSTDIFSHPFLFSFCRVFLLLLFFFLGFLHIYKELDNLNYALKLFIPKGFTHFCGGEWRTRFGMVEDHCSTCR